MHRSAQEQGTSSSDWGAPPVGRVNYPVHRYYLPMKNSPLTTLRTCIRASAVFRFSPSHFTWMQQIVMIHWIRCEGNGYFSLHLPDTTNKSTPQQ